MAKHRRDRTLGDGVYFAPQDYIGLGPRLVIFLVDSIVLLVIVWLMAVVWLITLGEYSRVFLMLVGWAVWLYVVPLKRSDFRTLGYRLMKCRLVTLRGDRPSLMMLTFRSLLWLFGPCNFLLDLIWCGIDPDRQTMRDRFSMMCLVRNGAEPIGEGQIHLAYYTAMGYSLTLPRVVHPESVEVQEG